MIELRRRFCGRDFLLGMLIARISPDYNSSSERTKLPRQMVMAIGLRAFRDENTGKTRTCIAVVKLSCTPVVARLLLACVVALANFCSADAADDPRSATRTRLERIQSLQKERPGDGVLMFYEAITRIELGEREAAFALLRSLQGRKLGLVPVRDVGFEAV